jgi:hypothetical protein
MRLIPVKYLACYGSEVSNPLDGYIDADSIRAIFTCAPHSDGTPVVSVALERGLEYYLVGKLEDFVPPTRQVSPVSFAMSQRR